MAPAAAKKWVVQIHWDDDHTSPFIGPFGQTEAEQRMRAVRKRYRERGLTPPTMTRHLLRDPDFLEDITEETT